MVLSMTEITRAIDSFRNKRDQTRVCHRPSCNSSHPTRSPVPSALNLYLAPLSCTLEAWYYMQPTVHHHARAKSVWCVDLRSVRSVLDTSQWYKMLVDQIYLAWYLSNISEIYFSSTFWSCFEVLPWCRTTVHVWVVGPSISKLTSSWLGAWHTYEDFLGLCTCLTTFFWYLNLFYGLKSLSVLFCFGTS
jgi:hypothetical protein